jgi:hypothetical protein
MRYPGPFVPDSARGEARGLVSRESTPLPQGGQCAHVAVSTARGTCRVAPRCGRKPDWSAEAMKGIALPPTGVALVDGLRPRR